MLEDFTDHNRRAWNEIARIRAKTFPPAEYFAEGHSTLGPHSVAAARAICGRLQGLRLIHLQCATGEDTLSWAVLGLDAVGIDISEEQIELARVKASQARLGAQFVAADVYALPVAMPEALRGGYDLVFTGGGALVWLPDLDRWAVAVAALLKPGGRLILEEEHPLSGCLWVEDGVLRVDSDYFGRRTPEQVAGWFHFKGGEEAQEIKFEFNWPLGDVVTALAQAGLIIERLEEFPGGAEWNFGDKLEEARRLPGTYLLIARKP